jgi:hypothetical protein
MMQPRFSGQPGEVFNPKENGSDYFWYSHPPVQGLNSAAPKANGIFNTDADSDFYAVAISYFASLASAAVTESSWVIPLILINISDTASGKSMMNTPMPLAAIAGDGKRPYRLVRPRVFGKNATVNFAFTSFVAVGTTYNDFQVILHGYKIYRA